MALPAHYFVGGSCLYCGGRGAGEPCPARARREAELPIRGPYDPVQALRAVVSSMAWPRVGSVRVLLDEVQDGPTGRSRFRVVRDGVVIAEASEVGVEAAARVVRERLGARSVPTRPHTN